MRVKLEVIASTVEDALLAQQRGADRLELIIRQRCSGLFSCFGNGTIITAPKGVLTGSSRELVNTPFGFG
ncbi:hypothetical protein JJQ72_18000 [Paenibacillus sp. F411]|uniref:Uncharacterized protein n=1 Tax=Paenibacillus algicola TaxID=2565926 RepID=A0A4P8XFK2_9BACL|nr:MULTISPECIES: hypothetical protein [Paenibacillus]MBO2945876.1 hypothetical protein [Paenibacillus sp. F411]QCT01172.1 hypothetical protein E6C60_0449 [Paenibacillus algicola]